MPGAWKFAKESCRTQAEPVQERGPVGCKKQGHRVGLSKPFGAHISSPCVPDVGHGAIGLNICHAEFSSCFGTVLFYPPVSPFWNGNFYPLYWECVLTFLFLN